MILVDSNIPMYLVGTDDQRRVDVQRCLEHLVTERVRLATDVEVFQEILHRYVAINRREAIQPAFDALAGVVDDVLPVEEPDVMAAKDIVAAHRSISARDALHVAVMRRHEITTILTYHKGFDAVSGLERIC